MLDSSGGMVFSHSTRTPFTCIPHPPTNSLKSFCQRIVLSKSHRKAGRTICGPITRSRTRVPKARDSRTALELQAFFVQVLRQFARLNRETNRLHTIHVHATGPSVDLACPSCLDLVNRDLWCHDRLPFCQRSLVPPCLCQRSPVPMCLVQVSLVPLCHGHWNRPGQVANSEVDPNWNRRRLTVGQSPIQRLARCVRDAVPNSQR